MITHHRSQFEESYRFSPPSLQTERRSWHGREVGRDFSSLAAAGLALGRSALERISPERWGGLVEMPMVAPYRDQLRDGSVICPVFRSIAAERGIDTKTIEAAAATVAVARSATAVTRVPYGTPRLRNRLEVRTVTDRGVLSYQETRWNMPVFGRDLQRACTEALGVNQGSVGFLGMRLRQGFCQDGIELEPTDAVQLAARLDSSYGTTTTLFANVWLEKAGPDTTIYAITGQGDQFLDPAGRGAFDLLAGFATAMALTAPGYLSQTRAGPA